MFATLPWWLKIRVPNHTAGTQTVGAEVPNPISKDRTQPGLRHSTSDKLCSRNSCHHQKVVDQFVTLNQKVFWDCPVPEAADRQSIYHTRVNRLGSAISNILDFNYVQTSYFVTYIHNSRFSGLRDLKFTHIDDIDRDLEGAAVAHRLIFESWMMRLVPSVIKVPRWETSLADPTPRLQSR